MSLQYGDLTNSIHPSMRQIPKHFPLAGIAVVASPEEQSRDSEKRALPWLKINLGYIKLLFIAHSDSGSRLPVV